MVTSGLALAAHFGDGVLRPADVAAGIVGAVVKDPVADRVVWREYLETSSASAPAGATSTGPAARCRERRGPSPHRSRSSASATTGPARPGAACAALDALRARRGADRGPGRGRPAGRAGGAPRAWSRRSRCWPTPPDEPGPRGVLAVRGVLPGVAGDDLGAGAAACRSRFCDLPAAHALAPGRAAPEPARRAGLTRRRTRAERRTDPSAAVRRDPLGALAEAAGYDDPERWWEDVVESRRDGSSPFQAIAEAMAELRAELPETDPAEPTEARREAYMRQTHPGRAQGRAASGSRWSAAPGTRPR